MFSASAWPIIQAYRSGVKARLEEWKAHLVPVLFSFGGPANPKVPCLCDPPLDGCACATGVWNRLAGDHVTTCAEHSTEVNGVCRRLPEPYPQREGRRCVSRGTVPGKFVAPPCDYRPAFTVPNKTPSIRVPRYMITDEQWAAWAWMYEDEEQTRHSDEFCQLHQEAALENFDLNMTFFAHIPPEAFEDALTEPLLRKNKSFRPVIDLKTLDGTEGFM